MKKEPINIPLVPEGASLPDLDPHERTRLNRQIAYLKQKLWEETKNNYYYMGSPTEKDFRKDLDDTLGIVEISDEYDK